jgi:methionyl-tRNA formyltransferase
VKNKFNIIFMGTPDFSVPALKALLRSRHRIDLVVTQPDRPKGRGRKTMPPPVKKIAENSGIDVIQPENINNGAIIEQIKALKPDLFVVIAFGQKLSKKILNIPVIFPINIHASLLPKYRGSSPIQAAIANLDKTTGITTMIMEESLDTGDILLVSKTDIASQETAETLHDRLADMGAELICSTLDAIAESSLKPIPQNHKLTTYAPMLKKNDGKIVWEESSEKICAKIRAMTPWPGAFSTFNNKNIKIYKAEAIKSDKSVAIPGTIVECHNNELRVATGNGIVNILELMGKSGKHLKAEEFLRGNKLEKGMIFISNDF